MERIAPDNLLFRFATFYSLFFPSRVDFWSYPEQGRWEIYGLALRDELLKKVHSENAEKIFAHYKGTATIGSKKQ
jgi:hypothetical protein